MALTQEQRDLLLKKNHENIARKLAAGKTLTNTERRLLEAKPDPSGPDESDWVTSDSKLSAIFGPHRASFPRFRKHYPDAPQPRANGDHSVPAWRKFFTDHPELLTKAADKKTLTNLEIKEAIEAEKLRERKFKNDHREGQYLPKEKTLSDIRDLTELLKNKLRSALEDELPPLIQNQPAPIIRTHMKELVDRLCREFQEATV
jgi:hypothetical protein